MGDPALFIKMTSTDIKYNSFIGSKFNRLIVLGCEKVNKIYMLTCLCECGNKKTICAADVISGRTKSCNCLSIETARAKSTKHGMVKTPTYNSYSSMKSRCLNKRSKFFYRYGGRGITICDRWLNSFENFLEDMGEKPSKKHSIDRIDNNGNYEPSNCKWSTHHEQQRNKSGLVWLEHNGRKMILQDWANELGIKHCTLVSRLNSGWDLKSALTIHKMPTGQSLKQHIVINT